MFQCSDFIWPAQIQQVLLYRKQQQWNISASQHRPVMFKTLKWRFLLTLTREDISIETKQS